MMCTHIDQRSIGLDGLWVKPIQKESTGQSVLALKDLQVRRESLQAYWKSYRWLTLNFLSVHKILENSEVVWTVSSRTHLRMWSLTKLYTGLKKLLISSGRNGAYIQGRKQSETDRKSNNDTLIITKSLKDVMVFL
jgi:hypothetical protein